MKPSLMQARAAVPPTCCAHRALCAMNERHRRIDRECDGLSAVCAKQCEGGSAEVRPETSSAHHHDMAVVEAQTEGGIAPTDAAQASVRRTSPHALPRAKALGKESEINRNETDARTHIYPN